MSNNSRITLYSCILVIGLAIGIGKLIDIFKWCFMFEYLIIIYKFINQQGIKYDLN